MLTTVLVDILVDVIAGVVVIDEVKLLAVAVTLVIDGDTGDYISKEYSTIIHTSCCCS